MPLRRLLGLPATAAAAAGRFRRGLATAVSRPPWAVIEYTSLVTSPARHASFQLAEPPCTSRILFPEHLVDPRPRPGYDSDIIGVVCGNTAATSGDGLLLLDFMDARATAPIVATHAASRERKITGISTDADMTRFVCNPLTGQLFRLPDIDGTKKTACCRNVGLLTWSANGHGAPDKYAVAELSEDRRGEEGSFVMRRFLSETGEWEKLVGLRSPLPPGRRIDIHTHHEVLAFAGRLWWVDLSWGVVSADPFSDRPELRFVELPRGSVEPVPTTAEGFTSALVVQGMCRRVGVSEGRLRYVEVSKKEPFVLSSFALDGDGSGWTLEHQVALGRLLANEGGRPWKEQAPWIGVIDPLNASVVYIIVGDNAHGVEMDRGKVLGSSHLGESEYQPRTILTEYLTPCVLPPWLASSKIPSAGTLNKANI
ncbi:hypothetical protein ACP70R_039773 [Stipagrostis hirtigluma subsp. patula]